MQKYDTSRVSEELKKELEGSGSNLKQEVENLVKQFTAHETQVGIYEHQNAEAMKLTASLDAAVKSMTGAIDMIREIVYADASNDEKIKLLKTQLKVPTA